MGGLDILRKFFRGEDLQELKKNKYGKILILFFILMLVLTIISRIADSVTVAKVETAMAMGGTLVHRASAEGMLKALDEFYVQGAKGFFIEKIYVAEGEAVEKGDLLFNMNGEQVRNQLDDVNNEIATLELEIRKLKMVAVSKMEQKLARAKADDEFSTMINDGKQMQADRRAVEDAQLELAQGKIDVEILKLQLMDKERQRSKLQKLYSEGGVVSAEISGIIGKVFIEQGKESNGEALCTIIPENSRYIVEAELDSDMARYMKIGDEIGVTIKGRVEPITGITVKSLKGAEGKIKLTAKIPPEITVNNGAFASVIHESITDSYDSIIPLNALRGTEGNYYVLAMQELNTVLGTEKTAVKIKVEVLDRDNKNVAVKESNENIISGSNKPIKEGDRVRGVSQ